MEHHRLHPAYYLSVNTGMRRGEVLGLHWGDVDLEGVRLSVRHQLVSVDYEMSVDDVKTTTGRRTIDLDPRTVAALRAWRKTQLEERMACGFRPVDDGIAFAKVDGTPTHPGLFSQIFERHVAKSTLPGIRLHDLRHTHASILLKAGVPVKVVSERLGHSSPAFTITVHQHVLPGMQSDAAAKFSAEVFGDDQDDEATGAEGEDVELVAKPPPAASRRRVGGGASRMSARYQVPKPTSHNHRTFSSRRTAEDVRAR